MGCDIHLYAEVYNEEVNKWEICAPKKYRNYGGQELEDSPWVFSFRDWRAVKEGKKEGWLFVWDENPDWLSLAENNNKTLVDSGYEIEPEVDVRLMDWDVGRDYSLFGLLAGVRGGWGDAKTIDDPRGMPDNCSVEYQLTSDIWGSDGHSHSYCTPDEIFKSVDKDDFSSMHDYAIFLKEKAKGKNENARFVFFFDN